MTITRTAERIKFLADVLTCAIENYGYGAFQTAEYNIFEENPEITSAVIVFDDEPTVTHSVNLDTIAKGIGIIRTAIVSDDDSLRNANTGERLFVSTHRRADILACSDENDGGEIDVTDALAILECALFGIVVYA